MKKGFLLFLRERSEKELENIFLYPCGGSHLSEEVVGSCAHDLWLDITYVAAVLCFDRWYVNQVYPNVKAALCIH